MNEVALRCGSGASLLVFCGRIVAFCQDNVDLISPGKRRPDGSKADHARTMKLDRSGGADKDSREVLGRRVEEGIWPWVLT